MDRLPNDLNIQQTFTDERLSAAKDFAEQGVEQGMKIANTVAGSVWKWYQELDQDSNIKQVLSEERLSAAKELAEHGTKIAQQVLEDERLSVAKEYAEQGTKIAHNVAGSVSEWYQELEPGYLSKWGQSLLGSETFLLWIYTVEGWFNKLQVFLLWLSGPREYFWSLPPRSPIGPIVYTNEHDAVL